MIHLDYIPGDLVMTNGVPLGTAKDVVYRVTSSDPSKTLELNDGTVLKGVVCLENIEGAELGDKGYLYYGDCYACVKDIVPIPLTSEIIERNGWKKPKRGVYEAYRNGVMYYGKPDTLWDSLWSKGYAKRSIQPYGKGAPWDIYYYSVNENGLKEMEKYLDIKIKILR